MAAAAAAAAAATIHSHVWAACSLSPCSHKPTFASSFQSSSVRPSFSPLLSHALSRQWRTVAPVRAAVDLDDLVTKVKNLTLQEARIFTDRLQEELGVTAASFAAPVAIGTAAPAEAAPAVEEKTEFDVLLEDVPSSARIAVIKVIRTLTSLGLKEAKDMIEAPPKKVKEAVSKDDAEDAKKQLEAAGAKVSIK